MADHVKKQNAARTLTLAIKSFMSLKDFDCICGGCFTRIGKMASYKGLSASIVAECTEAKQVDHQRLREILQARSDRYVASGKGQRSARIAIEDKLQTV